MSATPEPTAPQTAAPAPETPAKADALAPLKLALKIGAVIYVILLIAVVVGYCRAPEGTKFSEWFNHQSAWPYAFTVLNCLLLFALLYLGLKGPVAKMLDDAAAGTAKALADARAASAAAEALRQREAALAGELQAEKAELDQRLASEKQTASAEIMAQARAEAQAILDGVKLDMGEELTAAKRQLRQELAAQAMEAARAKIAASVTPRDRERLFDDLIADLEKPS